MDIVRRAKLEIDMISINGTKQVTSSRNVTFMTDTTKEEADFSAYDGIILPGGMPGTVHLGEDDTGRQAIREFAKEGKLVATHKYEYFDDYSMKNPIPYETYTQTKIAGKFEGMTEVTLFEVSEENPECKVISDT